MERVKVALPSTFSFSTTISIRITDLNYGAHVGNDVFLSLAHDAREQFLRSHGYSELQFEGVGLIMADAAIEYKRELNFADQVKISVAAGAFDKLGFDLYYLFQVQIADAWVVAAKIKTGMICFDYSAKKTVGVPAAAIERLRN